MPRKGGVSKREVLPDPIYNSKLVTRLINRLMLDGKRGTASKILYEAFDIVKEKTGNEPLDVFEEAMKNNKSNAILNAIAANADFAIPASMIDAEVENSWHNFVRQSGIPEDQLMKFLEMQGQTKAQFTEAWREPAKADIRKQLISPDTMRSQISWTESEAETASQLASSTVSATIATSSMQSTSQLQHPV